MREFLYFVASIAGAAMLTALGIIYAPELGAWKAVMWGSAGILALCAIGIGLDFIHRKATARIGSGIIRPRLNGRDSIMRTPLGLAIGAVLLAVFSTSAVAQGKTEKACREEWQAAKADFKAKGITEKAYVAQCHGGGSVAEPAPAPAAAPASAPATAAPASGKTASACRNEWRANKAANQAAHITEKAYVASCLNGTSVAAPSAPEPAPSAPPPAAPPPKRTATPAPPPPPASPGSRPSPPPYVTPSPGPGQFGNEAQAKASCPADTVVWVNTKSKIYHFAGYKNYGDTKNGAFMCERQAVTDGYRAAKNEKHPGA